MNYQGLKFKGRITFQLFDANGQRKMFRQIDNLVVNTGLAKIAQLLAGTSSSPIEYIGIGTGTTSPAVGNTALETPVGSRKQGTRSVVTTDIANDTLRVEVMFNSGEGTGAITEAGLFDAVSAGAMFSRQVFGVITKASADSLQVTWEIQSKREE